jgi:hypothetical protein
MPTQTFTLCDSTLISEYRYDDETWTLALRFRGTGELRLYAEFPPDVADDFEASASKGKFFNAHIARQYPVQKLESGPTLDPPPPVAADPELEADIAALEAEWVRDAPAPKEAEPLSLQGLLADADAPIAATSYGGLSRSLFPDPPIHFPPARSSFAVNGFDAQEVAQPEVSQNEIKLPLPEPQILSPEQAVAVISPKSPKADALTAEAHRLAAIGIDVSDHASYTQLFNHTQRLTTVRKALFDLIDPYREIAYRAYEAIQTLNKTRLGPPDLAIKGNKIKLVVYEQVQEAKRAEAQRLADVAAAAAAEAERLRIQEELTLAEVGDAFALGDTARAEELFENPIAVAPLPSYAARVAGYAPPPVKGGSTGKNWKAVVTDKEALILDIAAGIEFFKKNGHLGGHAPVTFLTLNEVAMNAEAKAKEKQLVYPGVHAENQPVKRIKGL